LFPEQDENSEYLRREDAENPLGTYSDHAFKLDGFDWPSVEHYFQANKFVGTDEAYFRKVMLADSPKQARKLGRKNKRGLRTDWAKVKRIIMTRAVYTKCRTHDAVAQALLSSGDAKLVESSQYDYYWGCGRDRRGENIYGKVLMDVREKLSQEREMTKSAD